MKIISKRQKADETETLQRTIREQKARIEDLKRENGDLLYSLDEYTKKENSIMESIGYLEQKKREQTESLNKKYAEELKKLRFFEEKWMNVVRSSDDPTLMAGVAFTREALRACREEILHSTRRDLKIAKDLSAAEEDFAAETVRLKTLRAVKTEDRADFRALNSAASNRAKRSDSDPAPSAQSANASEWDDTFAEKFRKSFGVPLTGNDANRAAYQEDRRAAGQSKSAGSDSEPIDAPPANRTPYPPDRCESSSELPVSRRASEQTEQDLEPSESPLRFPSHKAPAEPFGEPSESISPKKMSDREIVSLLEKLSV